MSTPSVSKKKKKGHEFSKLQPSNSSTKKQWNKLHAVETYIGLVLSSIRGLERPMVTALKNVFESNNNPSL